MKINRLDLFRILHKNFIGKKIIIFTDDDVSKENSINVTSIIAKLN